MPIDYKKYPPNWKSEIVPAILARADNRCENCGLANRVFIWAIKLWVKADNGRYRLRSIWFRDMRDAERETNGPIRRITVVLTVSHTDHDESNHSVSLDRLKALCQMCHLRYDAKEKYRRITSPFKSTRMTHTKTQDEIIFNTVAPLAPIVRIEDGPQTFIYQ